MLHVLCGPDDFSLSQALNDIKRESNDGTSLAASTTTFDGQQLTVEQMASVCDALPFFAEKRLVIINGLLARLAAKGKRPKKSERAVTGEEYKPFAACLKRMPESTVVVLVEEAIVKESALLNELGRQAKVKVFPSLTDQQLPQWIERRVKEVGGNVSAQAVQLLIRVVGNNLWTMSNEIDKLVSFAGGRRIEEADVKVLASYAHQTNVFAMADAIVDFRAEAAEQLLQQLLQGGAAPVYLLSMLSRQVRMIARVKALVNQKKSEAEMLGRVGLPSNWALRKTIEQAKRYSLPRIKQVYHKLLETDLAIKTGRYGGELALNILVAELCQREKAEQAYHG